MTIGLGPTVHGLSKVSKSFIKACGNVSRRLFLGKNRIIVDSLDLNDKNEATEFDFSEMDRTADLLKNGNEEQIRNAVNSFFRKLALCRNVDRQYCLNISYQLILSARRRLMEMGIYPKNIQKDESKVSGKLFRLETLDEMKNFISGWMVEQIKLIAKKRSSRSCCVIRKIKEVIEQRYGDNLSILDISRAVYLSPSYLSMIFKQETGYTINDYITKVRIEHAKMLLKNPGTRLCDISRDVGYSEPGYFSRIFKREVGMNPSEYRQELQ